MRWERMGREVLRMKRRWAEEENWEGLEHQRESIRLMTPVWRGTKG
jgi:hypothetical protein